MDSYHVFELIGEGSFGRVHKGRKRFSGQLVALKFIPKVGRSEKELRSLKREIEIMRGLQHPNIVQMFDSFETDAEVVVVTEYAEGELFQILEDDGNLQEYQVQKIACQLVSALYYLHSHRILHRDMKPQNILLGKCGVVKLCDFGFARAMSISTLVLTSIKGTPLYMSPELVEEKPYDHTADLWSLGCILYELHTGVPPFYTNSIFHLVQLIVRNPVKWPDTMSPICMNFLKGLLTKDPQKRLSWPDLLHHPFVADGVLVMSDASVFSPLTVTPSPDILALKHQQVMEKTAISGKNRLLRKAREQRNNYKTGNELNGEAKKARGASVARMSPAVRTPPQNIPETPSPWEDKVQGAAKVSLDLKKEGRIISKHRGQISRDYELEFPSIEVGPRLIRPCSEDKHITLPKKDDDTEEYWQRLALEMEVVIPQLKNKLLAFKSQLLDWNLEDERQILQPLRVLSKLIQNSELENSYHLGCQLGLPHLLFDITNVIVDNHNVVKQPWLLSVLSEVLAVLLTYWDRHSEWAQAESRLEELIKPFVVVLSTPALNPLAPVAASVLSMFTHHGVSVDVGITTLSTLLKNSFLDSHKPHMSLAPGWGHCDGLLSLLLHLVTENENGPPTSFRRDLLFDLFITICTSLETTSMIPHFCSAKGLYAFLSIMLCVFTKDPTLCLPLFSESESKCIQTLGFLLIHHRSSEQTPVELHEDLDIPSVLSCQLLCLPFTLDLPSETGTKVLELYHQCGIVSGLLQMIQTLPAALLELPLALLTRLLLLDPGRSVPCLLAAAAAHARDFFHPPSDSQLNTPRDQASSSPRTMNSLLLALLRTDVLWESAAELLNLLAQVSRCSPLDFCLHICLEDAVLHQALTHPHKRIRAASCSLLGNVNPFVPGMLPFLQPATFKVMIDSLRDPCAAVRRVACRAVGNWLGFIGEAGVNVGRIDAGLCKMVEKHENTDSRISTENLPWILEHKGDQGESSSWICETNRTAPLLTALVTDPDALTRRHACSALGNLGNIQGSLSVLKVDVVCPL